MKHKHRLKTISKTWLESLSIVGSLYLMDSDFTTIVNPKMVSATDSQLILSRILIRIKKQPRVNTSISIPWLVMIVHYNDNHQ